jgi:hypothetical protein
LDEAKAGYLKSTSSTEQWKMHKSCLKENPKRKKNSFSFSSPSPLFSLFIIFPRNRVGAKIGDRQEIGTETRRAICNCLLALSRKS